MYKELDFLYRLLVYSFHYDENNIFYLSASKWRDADGDGLFDVDGFSTKSDIQYAVETWLKEKSDNNGNDLNLIYFITHGFYEPLRSSNREGYSYNSFDDNRDGTASEPIKDSDFKEWLKNHNYGSEIGRLVFLADTCMAGHYKDAISKNGEERIIMTSSSLYEVAELETGQDWGAFSYKFFMKMADGETDIANAFNAADEHVETVNFMSIDVVEKWDYSIWPQQPMIDDNGNGLGGDYTLPNSGSWHNVYRGKCGGEKIIKICNQGYDYQVSKIRVRFNTRIGRILPSVSANLYNIRLYDKDSSSWKKPDGNYDKFDLWDNEEAAYDDNLNSKASCNKDGDDKYPYGFHKNHKMNPEWKISYSLDWFWTPYIEFTLSNPITCNKIKLLSDYSLLYCNTMDIDVYYNNFQEGLLAGRTGL
jgi:hypothetical protein